METDYYSQDSESSDTPVGGAAEQTSTDNSPEKNTALLPKSFFKDKELEVGNECKVRIERVYDDDVEVSKSGEEYKKPEMENAMDSMDEMASEEE